MKTVKKIVVTWAILSVMSFSACVSPGTTTAVTTSTPAPGSITATTSTPATGATPSADATTTVSPTPSPTATPTTAKTTPPTTIKLLSLAPGAFFTNLVYRSSYRAGTLDVNGKLMTGTEIMHLVPYKGKLYAATSLWMENEVTIDKACQILVLEAPDGQWQVQKQFTGNNLRMVSLRTVTFTTDGQGNIISPVTMLLAAPDVYRGELQIYSLDDETGDWIPMTLGTVYGYSTTRAIGFYHEPVTGVDLVFAGTDTLGTITGVYDATAPGRIKWQQLAEFNAPSGERVMSFTVANGVLYCATSRHIYKRVNGAAPTWQEVYYCPNETSASGIRGLTAVPNLRGDGEWLLFAALSMVRHLDPAENYQETVELDMKSFLTEKWKVPVSYVLAAYNEFLPYIVPGTGENVYLFGFENGYPAYAVQQNPQLRLFVREETKWYFAAEARYFIRRATADGIAFELGEVTDPGLPTLVSVRTIAVSPFASDAGRVLYFGGFDCNSQPSHNTAWIYRGQ